MRRKIPSHLGNVHGSKVEGLGQLCIRVFYDPTVATTRRSVRASKIALIFEKIDQSMLDQIDHNKRFFPQSLPAPKNVLEHGPSLFWEEDAADFKSCLRKAPSGDSVPDTGLITYLSDTSCLKAWSLVQDALLQYQGKTDGQSHLVQWADAKNRAESFLSSGMQVLTDYLLIRHKVSSYAGMQVGIDAKLEALKKFNVIYKRQSSQLKTAGKVDNHLFIASMDGESSRRQTEARNRLEQSVKAQDTVDQDVSVLSSYQLFRILQPVLTGSS